MAIGFASSLILSAALAVAHADSRLYVLSAPESTRFDASAGEIQLSQISGLAASALGLNAPTKYHWNGLYAGDLFNRPRAVATITVEGDVSELAADVTSYKVTQVPSDGARASRILATGSASVHASSLASVIATVFGESGMSVSVSASSDVADVFSVPSDDASTMPVHSVSRRGGSFADVTVNGKAIRVPKDVDYSRFAGATYDAAARSVSVNGATFSEGDLDLFAELSAMMDVADAIKSGDVKGSPAVLSFTVTSFSSIVRRYDGDSVHAAVARRIVKTFCSDLASTLSEAFGQRALVLGAVLDDVSVQPAVAFERLRRDEELTEGNTSNTTNSSSIYIPLAAYAEYPQYFEINFCSRYSCVCTRPYTDYTSAKYPELNNVSFAKETSSKDGKKERAGCITVNNTFVCVWDQAACDCSNPDFFEDDSAETGWQAYVYYRQKMNATNETASLSERFNIKRWGSRAQSTSAKCNVCQYGFILSNGRCYLDGTGSASVQFGMWISITAVAAIIGTWYVLHGITDGSKWSFLGDVPEIADPKKTG